MRIMSDQPQMHFSKSELITVKKDRGITGQWLGGYEYRQGNDYMIIYNLQEAIYLARMGFDVRLEE